MANPSAIKLGKRTRSGLQRTVSRDSLSDLSKPSEVDVLAPISDIASECAGQDMSIGRCQEQPSSVKGVRVPAGELSVNVSLEGLRLEEAAKSHSATEGSSSPVKTNSVQLEPKSHSHPKVKRKWWAMGSRAFAAAATTSPPKKSSPTDQKLLAIPPQQVLRQHSAELLSPSEPHSPGNMEISLNDASPKWANSTPDKPAQSVPESCSSKMSPPPLSLDGTCQDDATRAQSSGTKAAGSVRKQQNQEWLHQALRTSPKKQAAPIRLRQLSLPLSPRVYCRQDSCHELADVLNACGSCRRALDSKKDIYMYGGEKAFCSVSCRSRLIAREEAEAKLVNLKGSSQHMMPKLW